MSQQSSHIPEARVEVKGQLRPLAGQPGVLLLLLHIPELFQQAVCVLSAALRGA